MPFLKGVMRHTAETRFLNSLYRNLFPVGMRDLRIQSYIILTATSSTLQAVAFHSKLWFHVTIKPLIFKKENILKNSKKKKINGVHQKITAGVFLVPQQDQLLPNLFQRCPLHICQPELTLALQLLFPSYLKATRQWSCREDILQRRNSFQNFNRFFMFYIFIFHHHIALSFTKGTFDT